VRAGEGEGRGHKARNGTKSTRTLGLHAGHIEVQRQAQGINPETQRDSGREGRRARETTAKYTQGGRGPIERENGIAESGRRVRRCMRVRGMSCVVYML